MSKSIVITGASTGIGYATAKELIAHGYHVFGSVRKQEDADRLRREFGAEAGSGRFTSLLFDVTDAPALAAAQAEVAASVGEHGLAGLVNNAGIAVAGPVLHLSVDEFRQQFEVNFFGLISVTQAFLPLLGARRNCPHPPGKIINISSVAGRFASPFLAPYAASKHAVEALSDSLRRELLIYGIDVISIQPGQIRTPIWDKAAQIDTTRFAHTDYGAVAGPLLAESIASGRKGRPPADVAWMVRYALETANPRPHITLPDSWLGWWLVRALPARWVDRMVGRRLKGK